MAWKDMKYHINKSNIGHMRQQLLSVRPKTLARRNKRSWWRLKCLRCETRKSFSEKLIHHEHFLVMLHQSSLKLLITDTSPTDAAPERCLLKIIVPLSNTKVILCIRYSSFREVLSSDCPKCSSRRLKMGKHVKQIKSTQVYDKW